MLLICFTQLMVYLSIIMIINNSEITLYMDVISALARNIVIRQLRINMDVFCKKNKVLTLLLLGFLEYVNWWGGRFAPPPSDLEN